jgi:CPA2 family monovalent cation:H+ antiporter-2
VSDENSLIATVAVGLAFALLAGFVAVRLRLPALVGYLVAGIAVGPFTPGFVADVELAPQLAEIGVILLMFGVGTHFSLRSLLEVRSVAVPGAVAQMLVATALGVALGLWWQWPLASGLVFGLALSVASTVVLVRTLDARGGLTSPEGQIAVGWLVVEDLVLVVALVLLPAVTGLLGGQPMPPDPGPDLPGTHVTLALTVGKVVVFIGLMLLVGTRLFPWLLRQVEGIRSRELFSLAVVVLALGVAFGSSQLFGVSLALGAFFAGVIVNQSDFSHRAASELRPMQDVFSILFFVAVGMLFDPGILVRQPLQVLATLSIIVVGKSVAAFLIVRVLRHPTKTAATVSGALAQIGEFSFILAGLGVSLGLLTSEANNLVLAGALLSITLNPLVFGFLARAGRVLLGDDAGTGSPNPSPTVG